MKELNTKFIKYLEKLYNAKLESNKFKTDIDQNRKFLELTKDARKEFENSVEFWTKQSISKIAALKEKYKEAIYKPSFIATYDFMCALQFSQNPPNNYIDILQSQYEDHKKAEFVFYVIDFMKKSKKITQPEIDKLNELKHKIEIDRGIGNVNAEIELEKKKLQEIELLKNYSYGNNDIFFDSLNSKILEVVLAENSILFKKIFQEKYPNQDIGKWNLK